VGPELEVALSHSASFGSGGREAFSNEIPVEGVYAANAENHASPRIARAAPGDD